MGTVARVQAEPRVKVLLTVARISYEVNAGHYLIVVEAEVVHDVRNATTIAVKDVLINS